MDFSMALTALKEGKKIARVGWNGKGMFICLVATSTGVIATKDETTSIDKVIINAHFVIKGVDNRYNTWVPSISDCLADDWMIV